MDINDVDNSWTWETNVSPPISKYFSEIFSPSNIKLTYIITLTRTKIRSSHHRKSRNLNKIVKILKLKIKKTVGARDSNAWLNSSLSQILSTILQELVLVNTRSICNFIRKKFLLKESEKLVILEEISIRNMTKIITRNRCEIIFRAILQIGGNVCPPYVQNG